MGTQAYLSFTITLYGTPSRFLPRKVPFQTYVLGYILIRISASSTMLIQVLTPDPCKSLQCPTLELTWQVIIYQLDAMNWLGEEHNPDRSLRGTSIKVLKVRHLSPKVFQKPWANEDRRLTE